MSYQIRKREISLPLRIPDSKVTRASIYKSAGEVRFAEAEALKTTHPTGSIYLAGYLIECYLKWALCKRAEVQYLQDLADKRLAGQLTSGKGHNLEQLCDVSRYSDHMVSDDVRLAFRVAAQWSPNIRYTVKCGGIPEAVKFFAAVKVLKRSISSWANS